MQALLDAVCFEELLGNRTTCAPAGVEPLPACTPVVECRSRLAAVLQQCHEVERGCLAVVDTVRCYRDLSAPVLRDLLQSGTVVMQHDLLQPRSDAADDGGWASHDARAGETQASSPDVARSVAATCTTMHAALVCNQHNAEFASDFVSAERREAYPLLRTLCDLLLEANARSSPFGTRSEEAESSNADVVRHSFPFKKILLLFRTVLKLCLLGPEAVRDALGPSFQGRSGAEARPADSAGLAGSDRSGDGDDRDGFGGRVPRSSPGGFGFHDTTSADTTAPTTTIPPASHSDAAPFSDFSKLDSARRVYAALVSHGESRTNRLDHLITDLLTLLLSCTPGVKTQVVYVESELRCAHSLGTLTTPIPLHELPLSEALKSASLSRHKSIIAWASSDVLRLLMSSAEMAHPLAAAHVRRLLVDQTAPLMCMKFLAQDLTGYCASVDGSSDFGTNLEDISRAKALASTIRSRVFEGLPTAESEAALTELSKRISDLVNGPASVGGPLAAADTASAGNSATAPFATGGDHHAIAPLAPKPSSIDPELGLGGETADSPKPTPDSSSAAFAASSPATGSSEVASVASARNRRSSSLVDLLKYAAAAAQRKRRQLVLEKLRKEYTSWEAANQSIEAADATEAAYCAGADGRLTVPSSVLQAVENELRMRAVDVGAEPPSERAMIRTSFCESICDSSFASGSADSSPHAASAAVGLNVHASSSSTAHSAAASGSRSGRSSAFGSNRSTPASSPELKPKPTPQVKALRDLALLEGASVLAKQRSPRFVGKPALDMSIGDMDEVSLPTMTPVDPGRAFRGVDHVDSGDRATDGADVDGGSETSGSHSAAAIDTSAPAVSTLKGRSSSPAAFGRPKFTFGRETPISMATTSAFGAGIRQTPRSSLGRAAASSSAAATAGSGTAGVEAAGGSSLQRSTSGFSADAKRAAASNAASNAGPGADGIAASGGLAALKSANLSSATETIDLPPGLTLDHVGWQHVVAVGSGMSLAEFQRLSDRLHADAVLASPTDVSSCGDSVSCGGAIVHKLTGNVFSRRRVATLLSLLELLFMTSGQDPLRITEQLVRFKCPFIMVKSIECGIIPIVHACLKLLKVQVRYLGAWKRRNMDLITAIYHHVPPGIADGWAETPSLIRLLRAMMDVTNADSKKKTAGDGGGDGSAGGSGSEAVSAIASSFAELELEDSKQAEGSNAAISVTVGNVDNGGTGASSDASGIEGSSNASVAAELKGGFAAGFGTAAIPADNPSSSAAAVAAAETASGNEATASPSTPSTSRPREDRLKELAARLQSGAPILPLLHEGYDGRARKGRMLHPPSTPPPDAMDSISGSSSIFGLYGVAAGGDGSRNSGGGGFNPDIGLPESSSAAEAGAPAELGFDEKGGAADAAAAKARRSREGFSVEPADGEADGPGSGLSLREKGSRETFIRRLGSWSRPSSLSSSSSISSGDETDDDDEDEADNPLRWKQHVDTLNARAEAFNQSIRDGGWPFEAGSGTSASQTSNTTSSATSEPSLGAPAESRQQVSIAGDVLAPTHGSLGRSGHEAAADEPVRGSHHLHAPSLDGQRLMNAMEV